MAKAFDKLETILQHNQGANPEHFDYGFNLSYGQSATKAHPLTAALRHILDAETAERQRQQVIASLPPGSAEKRPPQREDSRGKNPNTTG